MSNKRYTNITNRKKRIKLDEKTKNMKLNLVKFKTNIMVKYVSLKKKQKLMIIIDNKFLNINENVDGNMKSRKYVFFLYTTTKYEIILYNFRKDLTEIFNKLNIKQKEINENNFKG